MQKILIVEDDPALANGLVATFRKELFHVVHEADGIDAYRQATNQAFDLMILDLTLPGRSGEEICRAVRKSGITTPILMLTSKNMVEEKVAGLEMGADDYLTKPFDLQELIARARALLRRPAAYKAEPAQYAFGDVLVDLDARTVTKRGEIVKLSEREFDILKHLILHEGQVVSRDDLLNTIWGMAGFPAPRTVDNFMLSLRKKLEDDPSSPRHILSIYATGYRFLR